MAGCLLCYGGLAAKQEVSEAGAKGAGEHDPAVVSHEDEHDHKSIKVLHRIQDTLDDVRPFGDLVSVLARDGVGPSGDCGFIATDGFTEGFVAGAEGDDGEEGDEEGKVGGDVPLAEDDAEVVGVPGEEHVHVAHVLAITAVITVAHVSRVVHHFVMGVVVVRVIHFRVYFVSEKDRTNENRVREVRN